MDYLYNLSVVLGFVAIVLFLEGAYLVWNAYNGPEARRISQRLRAMSAGTHKDENISIIKQRLLSESPSYERLLLEIPRIHVLDRLLMQTGLTLNVSKFLGLTILGALVGVVLASFMGLPLFVVLAAGLAAAAIPLLFVLKAKRKRMAKLEQQLPDALDMMGRGLRAGHSFSSALQMVGDEVADPIASEFRTTFDELNYGISMQDALQNLATRVPSNDLRHFVIAVLIQRETGGNLVELLDKISSLIRARQVLMGTVRVLSAEGRLSAWILGVLPIALGALLFIINPKFMSMLWTDPTGLKVSWFMVAMMVIGAFWMRRIIKIHV